MHQFWKRSLYRCRWAILYALFLGITFPSLVYFNYQKFQKESENAFRSFAGKTLSPEDWNQLRDIATSIKHLNFKDSTFSDSDIPQLANMPKLQTLHLSGTVVTAAGLVELSKKGPIQSLYLEKLKSTSDDARMIFDALSIFSELESLNFTGNNLGSSDLSGIVFPKKLRFLSLRGNQLTDAIFPVLGKSYIRSIDLSDNLLEGTGSSALKAVDDLDLSNNKLTQQGLQEIGQIAVENLDLSEMNLEDRDIQGLTRTKRLERLSLRQTRITLQSLPLFGSLKSLRSLDLSNTAALGETAEGLSQLKLLSELELEGSSVSSEAAQHLLELRRLTSLNVSSCKSLEAFEDVGFPKHLESIFLSKNKITPRIIDRLLEVTSLTEIDLSDTNSGDAEVQRLLALPNLEALYLADTQITDGALIDIHPSPNLYTIDVSRTAVTQAAIDAARRVNENIYFMTQDD